MDTRAREDVGCTCDISARLSGHVPTLRVRGECVTRRGAAWPHQLLTTGAGKRGSHARADRCVVRVAVALSACSRCGRRDPPRGRLANKSRRDGAAMQLHPVWSSRRRPRWSAEVAVVHACVGPHICTAACVVHGLLPPRWWGRGLVRETASFGMTKNLGRRIPVAGPGPTAVAAIAVVATLLHPQAPEIRGRVACESGTCGGYARMRWGERRGQRANHSKGRSGERMHVTEFSGARPLGQAWSCLAHPIRADPRWQCWRRGWLRM